jgi:hypothetical protein
MPLCLATLALLAAPAAADDPTLPRAFVDGTAPGWRELVKDDFAPVNGDPDTWTWADGLTKCKGTPVGVMRTAKKVTNFELVLQWRHLKPAGNSGVFAWVPDEALKDLPPGKLPPGGIEVQILDPGYADDYAAKTGKKPPFSFDVGGDIFPVGSAKLTPFPPTSPSGARSFARKFLTKRSPEWNHYYVRGVNGEIRLWVNGEEVSGGKDAKPAAGYLCLESEGSPVEFKNIRIRELP